ncbi:hypothetical protein D3C86_2109470 [compost metagenome]
MRAIVRKKCLDQACLPQRFKARLLMKVECRTLYAHLFIDITLVYFYLSAFDLKQAG